MIEKIIVIKAKAEDEQIIKDLFKRLADVLFNDYQIEGYKIEYNEES